MSDEHIKTGVAPGDFPFPITEGPEESRYLTWIRNHSNYMAVRGLLDYVRAVGVLVRGALINFLIGLPYLLVIAVMVAAFNVLPETPDFSLTLLVLGVAVFWILLFPVLTPLFKIARHRRSLETGTDSSVKLRDRYERSFGGLLLAVVVVAAFEALPFFLDRFHFWVYERGFGWPALASSMAVALAVFSVSDKVLSVLGGVARGLALAAIGALGLLIPLLVVLFVADFLVFSQPSWDWSVVLMLAMLVFPLGILLGLGLGLVSRAFTIKDLGKVALLLVGSVVLLFVSFWGGGTYFEQNRAVEDELAVASAQLTASADLATSKEIAELTRDVAENPGPRLTELVEEIAALRELIAGEANELGSPPTASTRGLHGQLRELYEVARAAGLFGVMELAEGGEARLQTVRTGAVPRELADELENLQGRASLIEPLFRPQPRRELLARVFAISHESLEELAGRGHWVSTDEGERYENPDLPLLSSKAPDLLAGADQELAGWEPRLREVRREVVSSAVYSPNRYPTIYRSAAAKQVRMAAFWPKVILVSMLAVLLWAFCWLAVDVNLTSIHGLYRDRLASAFLIGADTRGDVDIEEDLDLGELGRHEAGSSAPYHLINVALNLQGSRDISVRDRKSDFFIFSKRFVGGERTHYCRSETLEQIFPQMSLSTAMAISAAAASPNMGRATHPGLVAIMTLLNVRLGYWLPNPGVLEAKLDHREGPTASDQDPEVAFTFSDVFREELEEVERRWEQVPGGTPRRLAARDGRRVEEPTVDHGLVGIGFSGGGIRSATINLGIAQALHRRGVFDHLDYMSTVSGGGYLGSSLSSLMRRRTRTVSDVAGTVRVETGEAGEKTVTVTPAKPGWLGRLLRGRSKDAPGPPREYRYSRHAHLAVSDGDRVRAGQRLIRTGVRSQTRTSSFGEQFRWRTRPGSLLRELLGRLDENHRWVNVSDGGHIENLAGIELLRRRCRYILIGDGEADPEHRFNGLATLIRFARIDLGIHIEIDVDALRLDESGTSRRHWAVGRIHYPGEATAGYLLYMKSSLTGDEDEVIREYRHGHPAFPHESTADQFFDEGQFEAYRSLGQHIGEQVLRHLPGAAGDGEASPTAYADLDEWLQALHEVGSRDTDQAL